MIQFMLLRFRHTLFLLAGDKIFNSQSLWYFNQLLFSILCSFALCCNSQELNTLVIILGLTANSSSIYKMF